MLTSVDPGRGRSKGWRMRDEANENVKGRTALMLAAFRGDTAAVINLLDAGADVNARDKDGRTALIFAKEATEPAVVRLLTAHGAIEFVVKEKE